MPPKLSELLNRLNALLYWSNGGNDFSVSSGFADASVAPIDFPIAPAAAMPKVLDCLFIQSILCFNNEEQLVIVTDSGTLHVWYVPRAGKRAIGGLVPYEGNSVMPNAGKSHVKHIEIGFACTWLADEARLNQSWLASTRFPALCVRYVYLLSALIGSLVCQRPLWLARGITLVLIQQHF